MKQKKGLIAVLCITLSLLLLLGLFSAAWWVAKHADSLQLGGLVGELLERQSDALLDGTAADPDADAGAEELSTHEHQTLLESSTESPEPEGSPTLRFFLSGCDSLIEYYVMQSYIEPGKASEWDHRVIIDDYKVQCVRIQGWAALFKEVPLQLGYRIDDGPSVYDDASELYNAPESSVTAALGMGAVSATGIRVNIPVEYLSGTHTVEIVVRLLGGEEGVICTFEMQKAEPPYVFMADAAYLADVLDNGHSKSIESYQYVPGQYPEKGYVRVSPIADTHFPYVSVCPYTGEVYSTGARYLVIKCRNYGPDNAYVNVSSGAPELQGGIYFTYTEPNLYWKLIIIDLAQASAIAVNSSYDITTLDFVIFRMPAESGNYCEIAWIATFRSIEDAQRYDADHPYAKG